MPEDDEEEEEAEEKEGDAEEEEEEEEEKIGNKLQRARAENLYIKTATGVPRASVESSRAPVIEPNIDTPIERVSIKPVQIATNRIFIVL